MLEAILARDIWQPSDAVEFTHHEIRSDEGPWPEGGVVVFNARTHASSEDVAWVKRICNRLTWSVVLICGDEEWVFPWRKLRHPRRRLWAMQAHPEHQTAGMGLLPGGWYPGTLEHLDGPYRQVRPLLWFFAGQVTHERRQQAAEVMRSLPFGEMYETDGYLQEAVPRTEYFRLLSSAWIAPCPSGPYSVDCARAFEALEAGCIPVLDLHTPYGPDFDYWALLFGAGHPCPTIDKWADLPDLVELLSDGLRARANRCFAFWQGWKRNLALRLERSVRDVAEEPAHPRVPSDLISVIVTSSPCEVHPSTDHLFQMLDSVRAQLPDAEIIVVFDGVRPEQEHLRERYEQYQGEALWRINQEHNMVPVRLEEWGHQSSCLRAALALVDRPLVFLMEHDTPIEGDIDWPGLCELVLSKDANMVRLHIADSIHWSHEKVMLDHETVIVDGVPVRRTAAFYARPHLASTSFYRSRILPRLHGKTFVEDVIYPEVATFVDDHGETGWRAWKFYVYTPEGTMLRSLHLDSRGSEQKYDQEP